MSVCFTQSWDGVGIYRRALCFMSVCFRQCVNENQTETTAAPLRRGSEIKTHGRDKKKAICFKKKKANLFICHITTQHVSSDNNPLIDNCSESTLRNQMFSDLYALRNRGVCGTTHWNTTKILKRHTTDSHQRNIYYLLLLNVNMTLFVPSFLNLLRIFVTS